MFNNADAKLMSNALHDLKVKAQENKDALTVGEPDCFVLMEFYEKMIIDTEILLKKINGLLLETPKN